VIEQLSQCYASHPIVSRIWFQAQRCGAGRLPAGPWCFWPNFTPTATVSGHLRRNSCCRA